MCGYFPQSEISLKENQCCYDELNGEWGMHSAGDLVMCFGDINGHFGWYIDGFDGVNGGYGVGPWNLEGRILLEFCLEKELCVSNTSSKR